MNISIFAPTGSFGSIEEASIAEDSLDWQAAPGGSHRACTLSFAAVEMRDHLVRVPEIKCHLAALEHESSEQVRADIKITITTLQDQKKRVDDIGSQGYQLSTEIDKAGNPLGYMVLGNDAQGALYGTYELLHAFGFRWFSPDPWDQIAPSKYVFQ
ncbi:MAG: hypothetical protein HN368_08350 [Spirochaetales bacterium]|jgi:hypothetical protein|nr:hypothetical protein [Spirochaetales bacterium]